MEKNTRYFSEINVARGIAVILVLLGHSFPDAQTGFAYKGALWVFDSLYAFHMALFFCLSGFVTGGKIYAGEGSWRKEFVKKCQRLMVPYLIYSVITVILKLFMNDYANNPFKLSDMWKILAGKNPNGGLWYLWTLFVISLIIFALSKLIKNTSDSFKTILLLVLGLVCYLIWRFFEVGYLGNVMRYMFFYNLGLVCFKLYNKIKDRIFHLGIAIVALVLVFVMECPYLHIKPEYIVTALFGSYAIFTFAILINKKMESKLFKFFNFSGDYSYDIYMLSYFVQVPIRVVCWGILGFPYWINVLLMFIGGFLGPVIISKYIIRKVALFRKLFIGDWK